MQWLHTLTAIEGAQAISAGNVASEALVRDWFERIHEREPWCLDLPQSRSRPGPSLNMWPFVLYKSQHTAKIFSHL
jgi:hypothetical protein